MFLAESDDNMSEERPAAADHTSMLRLWIDGQCSMSAWKFIYLKRGIDVQEERSRCPCTERLRRASCLAVDEDLHIPQSIIRRDKWQSVCKMYQHGRLT